MAFFGTLKPDAIDHAAHMAQKKAALRADWGITNGNLNLGVVNTLTIWDEFETYRDDWLKYEKDKRRAKAAHYATPNPPIKFQRPLIPALTYSVEYSANFGREPCSQSVYAIDGGDQTAYEFTRGLKGGAGVVTCGWVATQDGTVFKKFPANRQLQLVNADVVDLQNFSQLVFGEVPNVNPDSMRVRDFAARRRTQLEFLQLSYLIDLVEPGSIILLDGFLKAMFTPPIGFIHEIGKKAVRKGVIILGIAKSSKIDMWLHFREYWDVGRTSTCWIRPPAVVTDKAYPSTGDDTNQFLHLGTKGRGIGLPIAATFNPASKNYYVVDFNCYDFEAAKPYIHSEDLPEVQVKYFPLLTKDKDFISRVLAQVAYYSDKITCLGYPFPTAAAHQLVKITHHDVKKLRALVRPEMLSCGISIKDMYDFQEDPRKILDAF